MLSLLRNVETISSCRDRQRLPVALLEAVQTLLGVEADVGVFSRAPQGEVVLKMSLAWDRVESEMARWLTILDDLRGDGGPMTRRIGGRNYGAMLLQVSELTGEQLILAYAREHDTVTEHDDSVGSLARIYGSQIKLLDYSELDTLTRLLNRKTFDETFDRLLTTSSSEISDCGVDDRRKESRERSQAWLCIIDIDHFKRINDSFGHLFGDEVLLRMGDLMRKTFRGDDRLFRFGGEEFVVILNAADETLAARSFNRFRASVENHEFPQVGKVTCSIGFTAVSNGDVPTDVLGRADEALYFGKEHGRNQVCYYERLVDEGALTKPVVTDAQVATDFDIDALFG